MMRMRAHTMWRCLGWVGAELAARTQRMQACTHARTCLHAWRRCLVDAHGGPIGPTHPYLFASLPSGWGGRGGERGGGRRRSAACMHRRTASPMHPHARTHLGTVAEAASAAAAGRSKRRSPRRSPARRVRGQQARPAALLPRERAPRPPPCLGEPHHPTWLPSALP